MTDYIFNTNDSHNHFSLRLRMMEPFLILDELIIPNSQLDVKNFFESHFLFFFQGEWIGLVTNLILYAFIILILNHFVKKKVLSFSFFSFGMDFSVSECIDLFLSKKSLDFLVSLSYNKTIKRQGWSLCSYP